MAVPGPASDALLELVHDPAYIAAVRRAGETLAPDPAAGLGTMDNPVFAGMHEVSALVAGASVAAASAVWGGVAGHAANLAGGLHHAMRDAASGFCVYNGPRSRSIGCLPRVPNGSPTSTSTCTTRMACRRPSTQILAC